jgi:hypothetical protein
MNCCHTCQLYLSFFICVDHLREEEDISFDGEFLTVWHFVVHG